MRNPVLKFLYTFIHVAVLSIFIAFMFLPLEWYFINSLKTDSQKIVAAEKILPYNSVTGEIDIDWNNFGRKVFSGVRNFDFKAATGIFLVMLLFVSSVSWLSFLMMLSSKKSSFSVTFSALFTACASFLWLFFAFRECGLHRLLFVTFVLTSICITASRTFICKKTYPDSIHSDLFTDKSLRLVLICYLKFLQTVFQLSFLFTFFLIFIM